ncbi:hypothetical protein ACFORL_04525 [Legionella dresdenensis]|uniref:Uncharacterized protein n=1 Tax=Legionella dresdenensis TaxID=450200 RepID=A0ABV8CDW0_9GAMM
MTSVTMKKDKDQKEQVQSKKQENRYQTYKQPVIEQKTKSSEEEKHFFRGYN